MTADIVEGVAWIDALAPLWFLVCWSGYAAFADGRRRRTLMLRMHEYRLAWIEHMARRDNRILDTQIVAVLVHNISFFASAAILIVGGLVAMLGSRDAAMAALADLPLASMSSARVWEAKVMLLIVTFVYAFFTFTWALRQFNYVAIMIGATPDPEHADHPETMRLLQRTAQVATNASDYFNKAMRAFYFGLAGLTWFISPWIFLGVTAWVVGIIWRREFRSAALAYLGPVGEPIGRRQPSPGPQASP